jgi:bacteriocin-like protein
MGKKSYEEKNKNSSWRKEKLIHLTMKNLNYEEMKSINGGNVPAAYYMDDDVINANWSIMKPWLEVVGKTIVGLGKEIMKGIFL